MHSLDSHPLLTDELLRIKAPLQREGLAQVIQQNQAAAAAAAAAAGTNGNASDDQSPDVVDSFGSLAISDSGRTNYFGQATSSWVSGAVYRARVRADAVFPCFPQHPLIAYFPFHSIISM